MSDHIKDYQEKIDEELRERVENRFKSGDEISVSLIQRYCKSGYYSASRVLSTLIREGKVVTDNPREIIIKGVVK